MARTIRNQKLDTRSARSKLAPRREPYWAAISKGCAVGYRRSAKGSGTWVARFRDTAGKQHYRALGGADDARDANGVDVFDFTQAQALARGWFDRAASEPAGKAEATDEDEGPYTVAKALADYRA